MNAETILRLCQIFAEAKNLSISTVSTYAAGSGDFCARLEDGKDITTRRAARVTQWISDHWPEDLEWPADIPRPAPSKDAA